MHQQRVCDIFHVFSDGVDIPDLLGVNIILTYVNIIFLDTLSKNRYAFKGTNSYIG